MLGILSLIIAITLIGFEIFIFVANYGLIYILGTIGDIPILTVIFLLLHVFGIILGIYGRIKNDNYDTAKAGIIFGFAGIIVIVSLIMTELGIYLVEPV